MEISKLPGQGLLLKTKTAELALDPFDSAEKITAAAAKVDSVLSTKSFLKTEKLGQKEGEDVRVFSWPGEYEVKGVAMQGYPVSEVDAEESVPLAFVIYAESFKIAYLPALKKELHSDLIEKIGDVDLLIFPVTKDEKVWSGTLEEIEPKAILPLATADNPMGPELLIQRLAITKPEESAKIIFKTKADFSGEKMLAFLLA